MPALTDQVKADIVTQALQLADSLLLNAPEAAEDSAQSFIKRNEAKIARWLTMVVKKGTPKQGQITQDEFASLVRGQKDLEDMQALEKVVKQKMAVDAFANSLISIAIQVGLTAVFGPGGTLAAAVARDIIDGAGKKTHQTQW